MPLFGHGYSRGGGQARTGGPADGLVGASVTGGSDRRTGGAADPGESADRGLISLPASCSYALCNSLVG